jgi:acetolactate synthase-1/2/3 large subunit
MLVITGQVPVREFGQGGIQEASGINRSPSIQNIFRGITKATYRVIAGDDVYSIVRRALRFAESGRPGPVHLEIPVDVMTGPAEPGRDSSNIFPSDAPEIQTVDSTDKLNEVRALIERARCPVVIAGAGVVRANASQQLRIFQDQFRCPIVTSLGAKGVVDEDHELSVGMIGCYGQDAANIFLIEQADLIIALGVSFQYLTSISWNRVFAEKPLVHVDIDAKELGKNFTPAVAIHGSVSWFLEQLMVDPPGRVFDSVAAQVSAIKAMYGYYPSHRVRAAAEGVPDYLSPAAIGEELSMALTADDDIVIDSGENAYWSMYSIKTRRPEQLFVNAGWGSMGYGAAAPIGVAAARAGTKGRVFATVGDGGFLMNGTELLTAVQLRAPVSWVVMDNRGYGTQKHWQRDWFDGRYIGTEIPPTNFTDFAKSMGVVAFEVRSHGDLRSALRESRRVEGPTLIWAHIDPEVKPPQALGSTLKK